MKLIYGAMLTPGPPAFQSSCTKTVSPHGKVGPKHGHSPDAVAHHSNAVHVQAELVGRQEEERDGHQHTFEPMV